MRELDIKLQMLKNLGGLVVLALLSGCLTGTGGMSRSAFIRKDEVPEYLLVDSRFSSGSFTSESSQQNLVILLVQVLEAFGYQTKLVYPGDGQVKISFGKVLARGSLKLVALGGTSETGYSHTYTCRVKIADYPSTVAQDREVNALADHLTDFFADRSLQRAK